MTAVLSLIGMTGSFFLIKYREKIGEITGEAEWMRKIGGVHNFIVFLAVAIFFWSIAELTGTTSIFFKPILFLIPGAQNIVPEQDF